MERSPMDGGDDGRKGSFLQTLTLNIPKHLSIAKVIRMNKWLEGNRGK
jgi:hypothetical protein